MKQNEDSETSISANERSEGGMLITEINLLTNHPLDGITITVRFEETKKPTSAGDTYRQCSDKPKFIDVGP